MKRTATAAVLCTILVGALASIGANNAGSPSGIPDLEGKTVVIVRPGYPLAQDVTLGVIGERQFLVMPSKGDDGLAYDYWIPLDSVSGLMVFDDMEDAAKYQARFSRTRGRSGSHAAQSPTPELPSSRLALDGACAVSYVELNAVVKGEEKFQSTYRGLRYNFLSEEEKLVFDASPEFFAVAYGGVDIVASYGADGQAKEKSKVYGTGKKTHRYEHRTYQFADEQNMRAFAKDPGKFIRRAQQALYSEAESKRGKTITELYPNR